MNGQSLLTPINCFKTSKLFKIPGNNFIKPHALSYTVVEIILL